MLKILGLSKKEQKVLLALQGGLDTPVKIAKETDISRTAIYAILANLKKRGLADSHTKSGRKGWALAGERGLEETLYAAKRALLQIPEGREEVAGLSDSTVIVHRGREAARKVIFHIFDEHSSERLYGFQGDVAANNWNDVFTVEETNRINRQIKQKHFIVEAILPIGWLERQTYELGKKWAEDFEGRTTRVNVIEPDYFKHGGQLFLFKESIYLVALGEGLIIEIRNSEIQRMLLAMMQFIQNNAQVIDANEVLRKVIAQIETQKQ